MAPTDADETERVGIVLQKLCLSPTLYEAPNRPEPQHFSPGSVESAPGCDRLASSSNPGGPAAGLVGSPELPGLPNLAGDFGEAGVAAGHDDIAAVTSTLQNIRLGFAQDAAATRVQRAMRAFLLRKGTIFITFLITKIQAAARGLNTRTSLTKFFKGQGLPAQRAHHRPLPQPRPRRPRGRAAARRRLRRRLHLLSAIYSSSSPLLGSVGPIPSRNLQPS